MASDTIPDYGACTLRELYLVLNYIDAERVPDTYAALLEEIEGRAPQSSQELLEAWRALDRDRFPEFAARLEQQIEHAERDEAARRRQATAHDDQAPRRKRGAVTEENKYKTFWRRFWAGILDAFVIAIPLELLGLGIDSLASHRPGASVYYDLIANAALLIYSITMHARYGQTLGKMLTRVKVLDVGEARGISLRQAIVRDIVPAVGLLVVAGLVLAYGLSPELFENREAAVLVTFVGLVATAGWYMAEIVTMLFNRRRRAVHDIIARTVVTRVEKKRRDPA